MKRDKTALILLLLLILALAGSLLLLGMTCCQVYILATYQGMPPVWQQVLFFAFLLMAGGVAVTRLPYTEDRV